MAKTQRAKADIRLLSAVVRSCGDSLCWPFRQQELSTDSLVHDLGEGITHHNEHGGQEEAGGEDSVEEFDGKDDGVGLGLIRDVADDAENGQGNGNTGSGDESWDGDPGQPAAPAGARVVADPFHGGVGDGIEGAGHSYDHGNEAQGREDLVAVEPRHVHTDRNGHSGTRDGRQAIQELGAERDWGVLRRLFRFSR